MNTAGLMRDDTARLPQPGFAPPIVHDVLRSSGEPLSWGTRAAFEPLFARDFSRVRVHADPRAAESARAVDAAAYTVGSHIVLGSAPQRALLAHELAHVAQQSGQHAPLPSSLRIAERGEAAEVEADAIARHIGSAAPARVQQSTGPQLARQPATATAGATSVRRIDASAASVSWIDPASPAGGHVTDPAPPATLTVPFVTGSSGFRFSNYLHGWCETADSVHLTNHGFETDSGIYRGPSYLGIPSHAYATSRSGAPFTDAGGIEGVEFEQLTGARTISAGVIGGAGGGLVGGAAGAAAAGFVVGGPVGAAVGGLIGGIVGWAAGSSVANRVTNFPPIWTRIRLRLKANGARSCQLVEQSVFPSSSFYCDLSQVRTYSALAPEQSRWEAGGWDAGNPWGASRPLVTP